MNTTSLDRHWRLRVHWHYTKGFSLHIWDLDLGTSLYPFCDVVLKHSNFASQNCVDKLLAAFQPIIFYKDKVTNSLGDLLILTFPGGVLEKDYQFPSVLSPLPSPLSIILTTNPCVLAILDIMFPWHGNPTVFHNVRETKSHILTIHPPPSLSSSTSQLFITCARIYIIMNTTVSL